MIRSENAVRLRLFGWKVQFDYDDSVGKCSLKSGCTTLISMKNQYDEKVIERLGIS